MRLAAEIGKGDRHRIVAPVDQAERELRFRPALPVLGLEIPAARGLALDRPAVADGALRHDEVAAVRRDGDRLPGRATGGRRAGKVAPAQIAVRHAALAVPAQAHQHRHVGVAAAVVLEIRHLPVEEELAQDDVAHGHGERGVRALLRVQPEVRELGDLRIVGRHRDHFRAVVARLDEEMGVWRARLRHVRAPGDDVAGVVPVGRFRHVGLLAPGLRARGRQVAVPVVEGEQGAPDQAEIARPGRVGDHRHRRDGREADHAVRAPCLYGMDIGGGDDLARLLPGRTHEAAATAHRFVGLRRLGVADDRGPGLDGPQRLARLPPGLDEPSAHHRVFDAARAVEIPAVGGAARAAPRLMVGHAGPGAGIVRLLRLPGDDAALHVDLPAAGPGAVHAMGGAHDLVVLPALPIALLPHAVFVAQLAMALGEGLSPAREIGHPFQKMAHRAASSSRRGGPPSPTAGARRTSVR